jgi:2-methylisocitrate lyase-like PEP mutase family enzyme
LLAAKIAAAKAVAKRVGVDLFINARTDVYLRSLVSPDLAVSETIKRARLYQNAGADGIFVPVLVNLNEMRQIAEAVPLPLNVMALPGIATVNVLKEHGVRRVSVGPALFQTAMDAARKAAMEILDKGRFDTLFSAAVPFGEMNELFTSQPR